MKNLNLNARNILIIFSYLFVAIAVFALGYLFGFKSIDDKFITEATSQVNSPYQSSSPTLSPHNTSYRVILEDREIRLYIDEGGTSRLISAEEISETAYPVSDIASLKNGFTFDSMDKAISLMENFIS